MTVFFNFLAEPLNMFSHNGRLSDCVSMVLFLDKNMAPVAPLHKLSAEQDKTCLMHVQFMSSRRSFGGV